MAGSHTMMPGIIYTTNRSVLNVTNVTSGLPNQEITLSLTRPTVNGMLSINGHPNNVTTSTTAHRVGNKIIIQGPTSHSSHTINSIAGNTTSNLLNQISSNGVSGNSSHINEQSKIISDSCTVKQNCIEVVGISDLGRESSNDIKQEPEDEEEPVIDIMINNVVCSFSVGCHLNLRNIALMGKNVEFRKEHGMVTLKLRRPLTTASIWSSGKITCTGSTSEDQARIAARRVARSLQKLGYNVRFRNYRIVNVLGTCTMPFAIKISHFSQKHRRAASYEPELHPGVTYRIEQPKATLKIFSTGSITVTAPSVGNVQNAIETIYPLVKEFSKQRTQEELIEIKKLHMKRNEDEWVSEQSDQSEEEK